MARSFYGRERTLQGCAHASLLLSWGCRRSGPASWSEFFAVNPRSVKREKYKIGHKKI
jgi:hypothetical protein